MGAGQIGPGGPFYQISSPLQLICVNALDLLGLDAELIKRLPLTRVVETDHKLWDAHVGFCSLHIALRLPQ
jgi:hypothetical protein